MQRVCMAALLLAGAQASAQMAAVPTPRQPKGGFIAEERKPAPPLSPQTQDTLDRINAYRAAGATCGTRRMEPAPPMAWNESLQRAAEVQARDIARRATVSHDGSDGSSVGDRATRQGYVWGSVGENAAAGRATAAATLAQWMGSPGHCSNMMGGYREVGMAGVNLPGTTYNWYWIMVVASPRQ